MEWNIVSVRVYGKRTAGSHLIECELRENPELYGAPR